MGLPLLCLIAVCLPPASPILTSATTPILSLGAALWLTSCIQGSGSGQQTHCQLGGCPEELMWRRMRPRDPCDVSESFQRGKDWSVFTTF